MIVSWQVGFPSHGFQCSVMVWLIWPFGRQGAWFREALERTLDKAARLGVFFGATSTCGEEKPPSWKIIRVTKKQNTPRNIVGLSFWSTCISRLSSIFCIHHLMLFIFLAGCLKVPIFVTQIIQKTHENTFVLWNPLHESGYKWISNHIVLGLYSNLWGYNML